MLIQTTRQLGKGIVNPCDGITCGELACPLGFRRKEYEGHCCPYCVNPNIKVGTAVKGPTGEHGGKKSTYCKGVWCFPTLCTNLVPPTQANMEAKRALTVRAYGASRHCAPI